MVPKHPIDSGFPAYCCCQPRSGPLRARFHLSRFSPKLSGAHPLLKRGSRRLWSSNQTCGRKDVSGAASATAATCGNPPKKKRLGRRHRRTPVVGWLERLLSRRKPRSQKPSADGYFEPKGNDKAKGHGQGSGSRIEEPSR